MICYDKRNVYVLCILLYFVTLVNSQSNPFGPFCTNNNCLSPTLLYPAGDKRNFPSLSSVISRSTPDGINKWPVGCATDDCLVKIYDVVPRATWWDDFSNETALPTNNWFVPFFCTSPYNVNPYIWVWYSYSIPFSSAATEYGYLVDWPIARLPTNTTPGAWQQGATPPQVLFGIVTSMFNFSVAGGFSANKKIEEYDKNGLAITIQYQTTNGGSLQIPVFRGSPFTTLIFNNAIPVVNVTWGNVGFVNGIDVLSGPDPYTTVYPNVIDNGLFSFDIDILYNQDIAFQFRLYTNIKTSISVGKLNGSSLVFDLECSPSCVVRLACTVSNFEDPVQPASFYSSQFYVDNSTLDASANVYPVFPLSSDPPMVSFDSSSSSSTITFQWQTECMCSSCSSCESSNLLMLALPHHVELLSSAISVNINYPTMLGKSSGYLGSKWILKYNTPAILGNLFNGDPFYYQTTISNSSKISTIYSQLQLDMNDFQNNMNITFAGADCYAFGKLVAALARLVVIAQSINDSNSVNLGKQILQARLNQWLDYNSTVFPYLSNQQFVYDTTWGGIIPQDGIDNPGPDWTGVNASMAQFGSGGYNDHLFHYGYFLYASAVVIHEASNSDLEWWENIQNRVLALARDIANPNSDYDEYFTQFRHKSDWFVGHSWASGLYPSGAYPNIESTAEASNAWYSLYLLGYSLSQIGNSVGANLMTVGKFLLETDIQSYHYYSHLWVNETQAPTQQHNSIYPYSFSSLGIVGNLWGGNAVFQTFFSYDSCQWVENTDNNPYCPVSKRVLTSDQIRFFNTLFILGINVLPFTPLTPVLIDRTWLSQIYDTSALVFELPNGQSIGFDPRLFAETIADVYGRCQNSPEDLCEGWMAYAWQIFAQVGGEYINIAWEEIIQIKVVAQGSTLTNALHFVASLPYF